MMQPAQTVQQLVESVEQFRVHVGCSSTSGSQKTRPKYKKKSTPCKTPTVLLSAGVQLKVFIFVLSATWILTTDAFLTTVTDRGNIHERVLRAYTRVHTVQVWADLWFLITHACNKMITRIWVVPPVRFQFRLWINWLSSTHKFLLRETSNVYAHRWKHRHPWGAEFVCIFTYACDLTFFWYDKYVFYLL